jgi:hypothetical protein
MYNYTLVRLSCMGVCRLFFCAGVCLGGVGGIALGLLERSMIGILGGMFLGFVCGVLAGLCGLVLAAVFNLLAPFAGGIALRLEAVPENIPAPTQPEAPAAVDGEHSA